MSGGGARSLAATRTAAAHRAVSRYSVRGGRQAAAGHVPPYGATISDGFKRDGAVSPVRASIGLLANTDDGAVRVNLA